MTQYYLMNNITLSTGRKYAGSLIDDATMNTTAIAAAGGKLILASTTGMATAAARAMAIRKSGGSEADMEGAMNAALDSTQQAFELSHDTVVAESAHTHAVTSGVTGASVDSTRQMKCRDFAPTSLPAAGVTIHAQDAGGGALALVAGFTNPLPRRSMVITRGAGGPASVDYTCSFNLPDGTTGSEVVAVAPSGTGESLNAAEWTGVSTTVDPVSTSDFDTGGGFSVGEVMDATAVPVLAVDSVAEAVVSSVLPSGTIFPTTACDGLKAMTVQYLASHAHGVTDAGHAHGGVTGAGSAHTHTLS